MPKRYTSRELLMRYLIMLEPVKGGFAVQVPDLAISTYGNTIEEAKQAAIKAIRINLEAYFETGSPIPKPSPAIKHLENPDFASLLFTYVDIGQDREVKAA